MWRPFWGRNGLLSEGIYHVSYAWEPRNCLLYICIIVCSWCGCIRGIQNQGNKYDNILLSDCGTSHEFQWQLAPESLISSSTRITWVQCAMGVWNWKPWNSCIVTLYGCDRAKWRTIQSFLSSLHASIRRCYPHSPTLCSSYIYMYPCEQAMW